MSYEIVTHNGPFHADETFAVALLIINRNEEEGEIEVGRTRDPEVISNAQTVVDAGNEYNPDNKRFDHHQFKKGEGPTHPSGIPYSSFGMVWNTYGEELLSRFFEPETVKFVFENVRQTLVESVDAMDNGIQIANDGAVTVSHIISNLNPRWDSDKTFDGCFEDAVELAKKILVDTIINIEGEFKAYSTVKQAANEWQDYEYLVLPQFAPWQNWIFTVENELNCPGQFKYIIFPAHDGTYQMQCVPPEPNSFEKRKPLPEEWASLRGQDLADATNIEGAVFCHPGRFISGWQTLDDAKQAAEIALHS